MRISGARYGSTGAGHLVRHASPRPGVVARGPRVVDDAPPGLARPGIAPGHPALPNPPPTLDQLAALAATAPPEHRFAPGGHPSTLRNAHYTNTRSQLGYALAGRYNSVEGDVRIRDGLAVMQHDATGRADLTFEQWAALAARAGKHLRIDVKEAASLPAVEATLARLGIASDRVTFNVAVYAPWTSADLPVAAVRALRERHPASWITLNVPLPLHAGYALAGRAARRIGGGRMGVAVQAALARRGDVALLRRSFDVVNAWNEPLLSQPDDPARTSARLRAAGVNGMIDLRRRDDPLARA